MLRTDSSSIAGASWTVLGRGSISIITPSWRGRGVWCAGSAAAACSPSSRGEIASAVISGDLERDVGHGLDVVCVS